MAVIFKGPVKIGKYVVVEKNPQLKELTIEGDTHNHYHTDNSNNPTQVNNITAPADSLSAEMLRPYIDAGLVDEELMPAEGLSRGEKAVLAHDIAERLKIRNFWSLFERRWGLNYLSSDYNRFTKTTKFVEFQRRLNKIK